MLLILTLLACGRTPGDESEDAISSETIEEVSGAIQTFDCASTPEGVDVPGADGAASLSVEECSSAACFPNVSWRREGDLMYVSCGSGRETVLVRISG